MKWILTISVVVLSQFATVAQDEIYLSDRTVIRADIISVDQLQIRYKLWQKENGPTFAVNKSDVVMIIYDDGTIEHIAPKLTAEEMEGKTKPGLSDFGRAIIGYDLLGLAYGNISFSAEYVFFKNGILGLSIPYVIGTSEEGYRPYDTDWMTGFDINYYPVGQRRWAYYTGLGFRYGGATTETCIQVLNAQGAKESLCEKYPYEFYGIYLNNGVRFTPTRLIGIYGMMGMGFREDIGRNPGDTHVIFAGGVQFKF